MRIALLFTLLLNIQTFTLSRSDEVLYFPYLQIQFLYAREFAHSWRRHVGKGTPDRVTCPSLDIRSLIPPLPPDGSELGLCFWFKIAKVPNCPHI
jgi:hypothetical protein